MRDALVAAVTLITCGAGKLFLQYLSAYVLLINPLVTVLFVLLIAIITVISIKPLSREEAMYITSFLVKVPGLGKYDSAIKRIMGFMVGIED
jgi:hypothetical protein